MLVKIGPRLIDESGIECIHPASYTDNDGLKQASIAVVMKNGNVYKHKAKEETIHFNIDDEINSIYEHIESKRKGK